MPAAPRDLPFSKLAIPGEGVDGAPSPKTRPITPKGQERAQPFFSYKAPRQDATVRMPPPFTGSTDGDAAFFAARTQELGETSDGMAEALAQLSAALTDRTNAAPQVRSHGKDSALLTACLRAHNYSVTDALAAITTIATWETQAYCPLGPLPPSLAIEILANGFAELLPVRDKEGCAVIMLRDAAKMSQLMAKYTFDHVVKAIGWLVMEAVRESAETQLCGVTLLEDMSGHGGVSPELGRAKVIMAAIFPKHSPFKMGTVVMYNVSDAMLMISGWSVSRMFAPRNTTVAHKLAHSGRNELKELVTARFVAESTLPVQLGGPMKYNFGEWLGAKHEQLCGGPWTPVHAYADVATSRQDSSLTPFPPRH